MFIDVMLIILKLIRVVHLLIGVRAGHGNPKKSWNVNVVKARSKAKSWKVM